MKISFIPKNGLKTYISVLTLSAIAIANTSFANPNQNIELKYDVMYNGASVGHIETSIKAKENHYQVHSITRAEGIASVLMGGDLLQKCSFTAEKDSIRSENFLSEKQGNKSYSNNVNYDWSAQKITFNNDELTLDMPKGYIVDNCNFHFAASFSDKNKLKNEPIYVVDGKKKRVRGYRFLSSSKEKVSTPAGDFDTTKVVLQRELNDKKKLTFWLADDTRFYPIKFMDSRKGSDRVMLLKSFKDS